MSPLTGEPETYTGTTQATSLYALHQPAAYAGHLTLPLGRRAPFPPPRQLALLERMELMGRTRLSLGEQSPPARMNPPPTPTQVGRAVRGFPTGAEKLWTGSMRYCRPTRERLRLAPGVAAQSKLAVGNAG